MRGEVARLSGGEQGAAFEYLLKHQGAVPAYDLMRNCVVRITVKFDCLSVKFKSKNFAKLVEKHLRVSVTGCADDYEITVPFQIKRGRDVAMVVLSQSVDAFDLPPERLKHLVQGVVWRDEHFAGAYIKDIAKRERCSDRYVRDRIMSSFELLN